MAVRDITKRSDLLNLLLGIIIILLLNVISSFLFARFDLTAEKRFTLSPATKDLVRDLDDVVYIKVYLEGDFPAGFKRLRNATKEMLDEFRAVSKENIQYEFIDPSENPDQKVRQDIYRQLTKQGLQYTNLEVMEGEQRSEKIIFPGAVFTYKGKEAPLQILKSKMGAHPEVMLNNSIQELEYEIASTIRKLTVTGTSKIIFTEGHGELDSLQVADVTQSLEEFYNVGRVRLDGRLKNLEGAEAIIIAQPDSAFSEQDKFIIDQFVMRGGKVLWLIDPVHATMDSLIRNSTTLGFAKSLNLDDQLFRYGVRLNTNLALDLQAAPIPIVVGYMGNQPQQKFFPWYYFPLLLPQVNHPVVNNLNAIKAEFISTLDTVGRENIKKTMLLHTSQYTKLLNAPLRISLNTLRDEPKQEQFNKSNQPVAVLLEGEFESVFANRISPEIAGNAEIGFREKSAPTKMIVVADGDIIKNTVTSRGEIIPLGVDRYTGEVYGNKNFILNAMNFLCDDTGLISVRSREVKLRLLDNTKIQNERLRWQLINMVVPVLLIVVFGVVQHALRKRKYARI